MSGKTDGERDLTDALIRIKRLKSSGLAFDAMCDLLDRGLVDRSVLAAYRHSEFMRGFRDGVSDANDEQS